MELYMVQDRHTEGGLPSQKDWRTALERSPYHISPRDDWFASPTYSPSPWSRSLPSNLHAHNRTLPSHDTIGTNVHEHGLCLNCGVLRSDMPLGKSTERICPPQLSNRFTTSIDVISSGRSNGMTRFRKSESDTVLEYDRGDRKHM